MKKIALIALALVMTLGTLGVAYAYWTETLTISGTVATGELDIEFTGTACEDSDGEMADGGTVVCVLSDTDQDGDKDSVVITVTNGYPCYTATCWLTVHNNGTIPAKVRLVQVSCNSQLGVTYSLDGSPYTPETWVDLAKSQSKVFDIVIHVEDSAEELKTYTFSARIDGKQSNAP